MKMALRYILTFALALLMCACGSKRSSVKNSYDATSEEFILEELLNSLKQQGPETKALLKEAYSWRGTPYKYGGTTKKGADCSGFVMMVFDKALGIKLPRTSQEQGEYCKTVRLKSLKPGDLLFYRTSGTDRVSHVGMYVGDGNMIHSSASKGIVVTSIYSEYFQKRFDHAGRVKELK